MPQGNRGCGEAIAFIMANLAYDSDECLNWPFGKNRGYGQLGWNGKSYKAHRLVCQMVHGDAPNGKPQAAHSCGNESCINHKHLYWASQSRNHKDRRKHGTAATNKYGPRTLIPLEQIEWMRSMKGKMSPYEVARQLGLSEGTARRWMKSTHTPAPHGTSYSSIRKRSKKLAKRNQECLNLGTSQMITSMESSGTSEP